MLLGHFEPEGKMFIGFSQLSSHRACKGLCKWFLSITGSV